jgi:hypothetical protein
MSSKLLGALVALSLICFKSAKGIPFSGTIIERESGLSPLYHYVVVGGGVSGLVIAN